MRNRKSLSFVDFEARVNELFELRRDFGSVNWGFQDFSFEFGFSFAIFERSVSMEEFIDDNAESPDVSFGSVLVVD